MKQLLFAISALCLCLATPPLAALQGDTLTMEGNTDRMGGDYRRIDASPSVQACHSACAADKECDAYTYVKSAHHCWLKKGVPGPAPNNDAVSGVKTRPVGGGSCATVDGVSCEPNTDRGGADYRRIDAAASIQFCQNQCASDPKCAAYTYVRSAFHCWLKEGVPNATADGNAVSGVKLRNPASTTQSGTAAAPSTIDNSRNPSGAGTGGSSGGRSNPNENSRIGTSPPAMESVLFFNGNDSAVAPGGKNPGFSIGRPARITYLFTYHHGYTGKPGTIQIINDSGAVVGSWEARGRAGSPAPSWYWEIRPNVELQAGRYQIETSSRSSWSQNAGSGGNGMVQVKGVYLAR